jgi:hypothetical protein
VKRLAASAVIAAQHLELPASDAAGMAMDVVREYRVRLGNYGTMRALDVWYDKIDLQRYEDRPGDPDVMATIRKRVAERVEAERRKSRASVLEPYAGRSPYPNHGQRVVEGQRLMQTASDLLAIREGRVKAVVEG